MKKSCRTLKVFGSPGFFCGKYEGKYEERLFLNCPYYENDGRDICKLNNKDKICNDQI
jgi:hypothetical protein